MDALTKNAIQILKSRYLLRNKKGELIETPDEMFMRVAQCISSCEKKSTFYRKQFYHLLKSLKFLPNSPTLMNAGTKQGQLSACFVLPIEDNLDSIFTTLKNAALIHQSGGGTGFNFSKLRPKKDLVSSNNGTSSGPIAFIKMYDTATEYVKQGGKRRGANMGILNINHPDIEKFITSKSSKKAIENFNISVGVTDAFMHALKNNQSWELINPRTNKVTKTVPTQFLWNLIIKEAWKTGDPGIIFLDTINKHNPTPSIGRIEATNPCGEVPLLSFESCNLGSINLSKMVIKKNSYYTLDWNSLSKTIQLAIRFLDNVITTNYYLLPEIESIVKNNRKIGLGIMGWAELLILLEIPYASEKALNLADSLMLFIKKESYQASENLAKEKGVFPNWSKSTFSNIPLRNATCNSIAPTGTISVIANTSYSIEPLFALAYKRVGILDNQTQIEINELFIQKMKKSGLWNNELKNEVLNNGSIQNTDTIPLQIKAIFQTSLDIPWQYHLKHQKKFQEHTDNAVSKTINLPEQTTVNEISKIYKTAWEYELKGITIYRYGSKSNQVLQKCNLNTSKNC
ncbi:adenosylcobalamin-dependent ribonucleoside-diphosphate reductase [Tenacibaculum larymnensis]|uniref:Vitamin B12-dependent ribonucleotide reductase n=1 Tax=Tenacibaculum larymnensis TaxID=2878201 RepID=A0A9X4IRH7_9FLAO|nr:adenosylcobalamin-dependent ribonucleoside-diphosphate reductase [Tenacibaculum larymnensis]MDE1207927.1 adenosylcobalamin-dependent ribonucleoside-diphosphate reductase [Tenacibaculum larymnensis]